MKKTSGHVPCAKARTTAAASVKLESGEEWVTANSLNTALTTAAQTLNNGNGTVRFVAGNTSTG